MGERRALIIAVPRYDLNQEFEDLSAVVRRDAERLQDALASSGYSVETLGTDPGKAAHKSAIRSAVSRIACTAPADATLLIHFTGHGLSLGGTDYLVPADAQLKWDTTPPRIDPESLLGFDLASLLSGCKASTVLITVDACRDRADEGPEVGWGRAPSFPDTPTRVAVLFGCGPDEVCASDEEEGSFFTRALAEAIQADSSPRTVADVVSAVTRRTAELARSAGRSQKPTRQYHPSAHPDDIGVVELCSGRTVHEDWAACVRDAQLWAAVEGADARRGVLQTALDALVSVCADGRSRALGGFTDPWADPDYPIRVLARGLRLLVAPSETKGGPLLAPGEYAALAAAPFVREAVYAFGFKELADVEPLSLEPAVGELARDQRRADLEHTWAAHPLVWRKGRELATRGRQDEARAVAFWLLHRHVRSLERLWETYAPPLLTPLAAALVGDPAGTRSADGGSPAKIRELVEELVRITRSVGLMPSEPYEDEETAPGEVWRVKELRPSCAGAGQPTERWRARQLTWLVGLSGLLAGDLSELPGVLVDSIGVADGLTPELAVGGVKDLVWRRDETMGTFDLDLACPHPAVHAALTTLTGWADDAVQHIRRRLKGEPDELFRFLPERVTETGLRPAYDPETKTGTYALPLMRFSLAEDEMREILMGPQLYGDRNLALRELYQNALDACRYRQARLRYAAKVQGVPVDWKGEIVFRQGTDEQGRAYVECQDNGVGMGRRTLHGTFARAGRRFEQSREFRQEQARWRRADPELRLYPNSRFGVGVFSYFMLADEISIHTRATDELGQAVSGIRRGLKVDIASTGSLFRIREGDHSVPGGGTRVRLYLQEGPVDVAGILGTLVWRTDFVLRVERNGQTERSWEPGRLYYNGDGDTAVPAGDDLWWVPGEGRLLADGLVVGPIDSTERLYQAISHRTDIDVKRHGWVMDLRGPNAPQLSTSRKEILGYAKEHVDAAVLGASEQFVAPAWFNLQWLWKVLESSAEVAMNIASRLLARGEVVSTGAIEVSWSKVPMRQIGLFSIDRVVSEHGNFLWGIGDDLGSGPESGRQAILAWRAAVLERYRFRLERTRLSRWPLPETLDGYPEPVGWEGRITGYIAMDRDLLRAALAGPVAPNTLGEWLGRLQPFAIAGVHVPDHIDREGAHACLLDRDDRRILRELFWRDVNVLLGHDAWESPKDVVWVLATLSVELKLPISEVLSRVRRFRELGFALEAPVPLSEPPNRPATREELRTLRRHPEFWASRKDRRNGRAPDEADYRAVVRDYAWLGLRQLPAVQDREPSMPNDQTDKEAMGLLDLTRPEAVGALSLVRLARASAKLGLPCDEVLARCAPTLEELAITQPELGALSERGLNSEELALLAGKKPEHADLDATPMRLLDTALAVRVIGGDGTRIRKVGQVLIDLGLLDNRMLDHVDTWLGLQETDWGLLPAGGGVSMRKARLGSTLGRPATPSDVQLPDVDQMFTPSYVVAAAYRTERDCGDVYESLRRIAPTIGVDLPAEIDPGAGKVRARPTLIDAQACIHAAEVSSWQTPLAAAALAQHAMESGGSLGESYEILRHYAPFGAPWTAELTGAAWERHRPTAHDVALLGPDLIGEEQPVGALELLRVAARFGWPMRRAWQRVAVYRPFGLDLTVPEPDLDVVPCWQDLILLTERLTGRAPAVAGAISEARIALLAREVRRSTAWVKERYALYAGLFGLTLPDGCPDQPAPFPVATPVVHDANSGGGTDA